MGASLIAALDARELRGLPAPPLPPSEYQLLFTMIAARGSREWFRDAVGDSVVTRAARLD